MLVADITQSPFPSSWDKPRVVLDTALRKATMSPSERTVPLVCVDVLYKKQWR